MSQQVKIERDLVFDSVASHTDNVEGNVSFNKVVIYEDFVGKDIDETYDWTFTDGSASSDAALTISVPHCLTITSGGTDNDESFFTTGLCWYGRYNVCMEARARNDDVSSLAHFIGFSDAVSETNKLPIAITDSDLALDTEATSAVGFVLDVDASAALAYIYGVSVNGDTDGTVISSGHLDTDGSFATYRVELRDNGTTTDALFYLNTSGNAIDPIRDIIGIQADAVPRTTALCAMVAVMNRAEDAADTMDVDYIKIWSDRAWGTST